MDGLSARVHTPVVLYRRGVVSRADDRAELAAVAAAGLPVVHQRADLREFPGRVVVPRYALWPWPSETLRDIELLGGVPINDRAATAWLWDTGSWAADLEGLTPRTRTWDEYSRGRDDGPVVLKGAVKSRRDRWGTHMFAADRAAAIEVMRRLVEDPVAAEGLYVRDFVALAPVLARGVSVEGIGGCPVTREFRVVVLDGRVAASGWYWGGMLDADDVDAAPDPAAIPDVWLAGALERVRDAMPGARFVVLDVAETAAGGWVVVELNDGCQSGLPLGTEGTVYSALGAAANAMRTP